MANLAPCPRWCNVEEINGTHDVIIVGDAFVLYNIAVSALRETITTWSISCRLIPTLRILRRTLLMLWCWPSTISHQLSLAMTCGSLHGKSMDSYWWSRASMPWIWIHTRVAQIINGLSMAVRQSTHGQLCLHMMSDIGSGYASITHLTLLILTCLYLV